MVEALAKAIAYETSNNERASVSSHADKATNRILTGYDRKRSEDLLGSKTRQEFLNAIQKKYDDYVAHLT